MEKIILAIDGVNLEMSSVDFACYLGRLTHSRLTGIFLENLPSYEPPVLRSTRAITTHDWEMVKGSPEYELKKELIEKNIATFKEACENRSVNCNVYRDDGLPLEEILSESHFADIVVVGASTSYDKQYEGMPTEFVKDILKDSECPVVIAPENFEGIDEILLTYDGSKSALFAMKQFTYLFPMFKDKKVKLIYVNESGTWIRSDQIRVEEWLKDHYSSYVVEVAKGDIGTHLLDYLLIKNKVFVVMGAYGRSSLSRFFKRSHADLLIKTITHPIFIAHY